ncbi:MAG: tRNA pseudouridine(13) synthase TruD, partial [Gammaproteobacteria bacterium]|nr:tRNA pseudouridine(13) synthase TruD [Gammaproteobacteria bacterium]
EALTTQWLSVPATTDVERCLEQLQTRIDGQPEGGFRVLELARHAQKLKRGWHVANRFNIRVRSDVSVEAARARAEALCRTGIPNYFGPQRFGRGGANLQGALSMLERPERRLRRAVRGFYLSAARSLIFNAVLARRVCDGSWSRILPGECVCLSSTGSYFTLDDPDDPASIARLPGAGGGSRFTLDERLQRFEIHPSGPLWGMGVPFSRADAQRLELNVVAEHPGFRRLLQQARMRHERRPLRLRIPAMSVAQVAPGTLECGFELDSGAFATVVLQAIFALDSAASGVRLQSGNGEASGVVGPD